MPADIEPEILVVNGSRDSAHILGIALEYNHGGMLLRQLVGRSQTRWPRSDNHRLENRSFHVFVRSESGSVRAPNSPP